VPSDQHTDRFGARVALRVVSCRRVGGNFAAAMVVQGGRRPEGGGDGSSGPAGKKRGPRGKVERRSGSSFESGYADGFRRTRFVVWLRRLMGVSHRGEFWY